MLKIDFSYNILFTHMSQYPEYSISKLMLEYIECLKAFDYNRLEIIDEEIEICNSKMNIEEQTIVNAAATNAKQIIKNAFYTARAIVEKAAYEIELSRKSSLEIQDEIQAMEDKIQVMKKFLNK